MGTTKCLWSLYYQEFTLPFEIFARAESKRYFERIAPLIVVKTKEKLGESLDRNNELYLPNWNFHSIPLAAMSQATIARDNSPLVT